MGEGGCGVECGEAGEGACLVRMKEPARLGEQREARGGYSFHYLREGF